MGALRAEVDNIAYLVLGFLFLALGKFLDLPTEVTGGIVTICIYKARRKNGHGNEDDGAGAVAVGGGVGVQRQREQ